MVFTPILKDNGYVPLEKILINVTLDSENREVKKGCMCRQMREEERIRVLMREIPCKRST
jgi:hypothetical protein